MNFILNVVMYFSSLHPVQRFFTGLALGALFTLLIFGIIATKGVLLAVILFVASVAIGTFTTIDFFYDYGRRDREIKRKIQSQEDDE